ncbi:MAG: phosphoglycerate dehydrogenase [Sphingomonadaceae bacterium]
MATPRVLITSVFLHEGGDVDLRLRAAGIEPVYKHWRGERTEDELIDFLQGIDGAIVAGDRFTPRVMDAAPQLKVISRTGVGYDAIDVPAATKRGIVVCNTPGVNRHAVAEYTFALILACSRHLEKNLAEVRKGGWARFEGIDLAGRTLGIVGMGTIGREVAQRARAFEMRILAHDIYHDIQFAEEHQVTYVPLEQLLRESDFVTLHCFLNDRSRHLMNAERLAMMKPTAYLINTSRGGVVDSQALYQALKERRIAGAALDVFEEEPLGESPLRELDNLCMSPHAAGVSSDARALSGMTAAENAIRVLKGERPIHTVNPEAWDRRRV